MMNPGSIASMGGGPVNSDPAPTPEDPLITQLRRMGKTGRKARRAAASIRRRSRVRS